MKYLEVISLESELKSFSWADGLYAIYKKDGGILHLWKIKDGKLNCIEGDVKDIICTGEQNKGVKKTDMQIAYTD
jgi:hypothetical protein